MRSRIIILLIVLLPLFVSASDLPKGDVNGDDKVNTLDYILVRKHILKSSLLTGDKLKRADINSDNKISASDYVMIRKIILGTDTLPKEIERLNIYLSPTGNDNNDGSKNSPIKTLEKAYQIQKEITKENKVSNIGIFIASGEYKNQFLYWDNCQDDTIIKITGEGDEMPIFTGSAEKQYFMYLHNTNNCRFIINHIKIQKYENGIRFDSRNNNNIGNNIIDDVEFYQIGDYYMGEKGYGAITLTYSGDNIVRNSKFDHILNSEEFGNHIHAVYTAWNSSNNRIYNNSFSYVKPDPIRFRSNSNNNKVYQNTFTKTGVFAYCSEWHSEVKNETICKGNVFYNNTLNSAYSGPQIDEIAIFKPDVATKEKPDASRLKASNNIKK